MQSRQRISLKRVLELILNTFKILTSLFFRDSKKKKKRKALLYDELNKDLKSLESFHSDLP